MESFLKKVAMGKNGPECKRYFVRFGKGNYNRRFTMSLDITKDKLKVRAGFELANDLIKFIKEIKKDVKFSGKILVKDKIPGKEGKKKAGVFVYEITDEAVEDYPSIYFYLLDSSSSDLTLKMKKALPKPGQEADKIDEKFCALDLDLKYLKDVKETFFWDVPEGMKKVSIENEIVIKDIEFPKNEKDPVKIRENAIRKGKIIRHMTIDGKEITKEYDLKI